MGILWSIIKKILILFIGTSVLAVVLYRYVPVYVTPLMIIRAVEQKADGKPVKWKHDWVSIDKISHNMPQAVVASEDNLFLNHSGFDYEQIKKAIAEAKAGRRYRGASTISQQTAKNVFLFPGRSWVRKGFEAYFTFLIEVLWDKERILEVYLNVAEMGRGIYGAEAAAEHLFCTRASKLTSHQASLIAACLPNPLVRKANAPSAGVRKRAASIRSMMGGVELPW